MSGLRDRLPGLWNGRILGLAAMAVVWSIALLGFAVPQWQQVQRQNTEIQKLERILADLERWTVAGLWLEHSVVSREPEVAARWLRLFPDERDRERVFLALAQAADRSGVEAFRLEEVKDLDLMFRYDMDNDGDPADDMAPDDGSDGVRATTPQVAPGWYSVKACFSGDYARTAAFLGHLAGIERAVGVQRLVIRPARTGLDVDVELKIYVNQPHVS